MANAWPTWVHLRQVPASTSTTVGTVPTPAATGRTLTLVTPDARRKLMWAVTPKRYRVPAKFVGGKRLASGL